MAGSSEARSRLTAFGNQLIEVHVWLREQLEDLRDDVDDYFDGKGLPSRDLRAHCLSFCSALTRHHTGEDRGAFPVIADEHPELRKVISELKTDHNRIDWILGNLEKLLGNLPETPDPATAANVRAELEGLSAIMETHFIYEEKKLISVLNSMNVPGWREDKPDFLLTEDDDE
ncbi:Hemerythrin HHE cation binding domain-containing protein [Saccharopolyspora shandongensis]|uniref:Hemerythrin HHE cation binding domain-containing protein n=1 Tax=Saccharopolyspora shandongensis TaxID=418495 RepID=A0A1H3PIR8_9PSEU|nr:hemerythrin domain-containing protein [Saccharopolyspora shandongensis]SDZ01010.1 Hemerythrin HHE cation binding domain-containing protein [Saccharopolyspora shandongensis]